MGVGVALVHVEQVAGPEVALLAAFPAADLDDDVLALVGVAGHEQLADPRVERGEVRFLGLDLAREVVAHLGVVLVGEHLSHVAEVGLGRAVRVGTPRRRA